MKYKQMSIYDFIEESQEVAPSETLPQVDEAQESIYGMAANKLAKDLEAVILGDTPSSALDTELPTEDTDKTFDDSQSKALFSVGDVLTVRQASDVYNADEQPEDFYYIKEYEGEQVKLLNIRGDLLLCNTFNLDRNIWLRAQELIKI